MDIWKTRICFFFIFTLISNPERITPDIPRNCFYELGKVCSDNKKGKVNITQMQISRQPLLLPLFRPEKERELSDPNTRLINFPVTTRLIHMAVVKQ